MTASHTNHFACTEPLTRLLVRQHHHISVAAPSSEHPNFYSAHPIDDDDAPSAGGVDANATKSHLLEIARRLDVHGRSRMTKAELVDAIGKANRRVSDRTLRKERANQRG